MRELYQELDLQGVFSGAVARLVAGQDVSVLRITPVTYKGDFDAWRPWHSPAHEALAAKAKEVRAARMNEEKMPRRRKRPPSASLVQIATSHAATAQS